MTTIDKHALEKLLAKWAGVEVVEESCGPTNISWYYWQPDSDDEFTGGEWVKWDPFTDANQMELVKAGLRKGRDGDGFHYHYINQWHWDSKQHEVVIYKIWLTKLGCDQHCYRRFHESESLAMVLAIKAMEEGH